jgi:hypothetical protein
MAIIYVNKNKFKIFKEKPSYGKWIGETKYTKQFIYTTNNIRNLRGIVGKKGVQVRYDK